jgi:hypothetical protein
MPFNGAGVFQRIYSWVADAANSIPISSTRTDTDTNDIALGLGNCVTRDGQSPALANLPMGGFKFTNVGNAALNNEYVALGQANTLYNAKLGYTPVNKAGDTGIGSLTSTGTVQAATLTSTGNVICNTVVAATTTTLVLASGGAGGQVLVRPNGSASSPSFVFATDGSLTIPANTSCGGQIFANTVFSSSNTTAVLSSSGSGGQVLIRPNGSGSSTGQALFDTAGAMTLNAGRKLNKITLANTAPGALADGELYLQY